MPGPINAASLRFAPLPLAAAMLLASCNPRSDAGPVVVSVIGTEPVIADAARGPLNPPARLLLDSVAQGLVRFDAAGQIAPGLAERWIVIDEGRSYIFRLREAEWSDGQRVTAAQVVALLRRQIAPRSLNPLAPFLSAIDEVVEMTPQVIEIRLRRPRPDLLKLFAQPEMAIVGKSNAIGTGPFRMTPPAKGDLKRDVLLKPAFDPARRSEDSAEEPGPAQSVHLIGERASRALVRFIARESDLIAGGSFVDWPLVAIAGVAPANLRLDPAAGLFGLAVVNRSGFLASPDNRGAIAQAINREALVAAFAPGWQPALQILPEQLDSANAPAIPAWAALSADDRRSGARRRVEEWRRANGESPALRIALPPGPGANMLFGFLGASLRSIGIELRRVGIGQPADLKLIDAVAPYDSARWYLATACAPCSDAASDALAAARDAIDPAQRSQQIARADVLLNDDVAFIPIARPLRWSVVALRLRQWQGNARAWHPLNNLRDENR